MAFKASNAMNAGQGTSGAVEAYLMRVGWAAGKLPNKREIFRG